MSASKGQSWIQISVSQTEVLNNGSAVAQVRCRSGSMFESVAQCQLQCTTLQRLLKCRDVSPSSLLHCRRGKGSSRVEEGLQNARSRHRNSSGW
jgi:hypothetical protein